MSGPGYGVVVDLDELPWTRHDGDTAWASLTGPLNAEEVRVDAVRLGTDDAVELADEPEQLLVPVDGAARLDGVETALRRPAVGLVPAGVTGRLESSDATTVIVMSAPADPRPDADPQAIDIGGVELSRPEISDIEMAFLTEPLGCSGMKVNARQLGPGEAVLYHTEGDQEELFVPLDEPAGFRVADETYELEVGSVASVAPEVPRSAFNDDDETASMWVMVGAPPTGGPTDWDPGAEIIEE